MYAPQRPMSRPTTGCERRNRSEADLKAAQVRQAWIVAEAGVLALESGIESLRRLTGDCEPLQAAARALQAVSEALWAARDTAAIIPPPEGVTN